MNFCWLFFVFYVYIYRVSIVLVGYCVFWIVISDVEGVFVVVDFEVFVGDYRYKFRVKRCWSW